MIYSTSDRIEPITITKATKSYKNCYFHKINNLRLKTDKFELPYRYSDKYNKITITMPIENPIYDSIHTEVLKALKNINVSHSSCEATAKDAKHPSLQLGKNGKIYLQITNKTQFFDHDRQPIDYEKGLEQLQRKAIIRCILTFNSICEFNGGFSYKVNVDQIQICDNGFSAECQFSSDSEDNEDNDDNEWND